MPDTMPYTALSESDVHLAYRIRHLPSDKQDIVLAMLQSIEKTEALDAPDEEAMLNTILYAVRDLRQAHPVLGVFEEASFRLRVRGRESVGSPERPPMRSHIIHCIETVAQDPSPYPIDEARLQKLLQNQAVSIALQMLMPRKDMPGALEKLYWLCMGDRQAGALSEPYNAGLWALWLMLNHLVEQSSGWRTRPDAADFPIDAHPALRQTERHALIRTIPQQSHEYVYVKRYAASRKPAGYWDDFSHLKTELLTFMKGQGQAIMPTPHSLQKANRSDLIGAIKRHGGVHVVAEKLGLTTHQRPIGYWANFANVERELRAFLGGPDQQNIPPMREFHKAKRSDLINAIRQHGGIYIVAENLGMTVDREPQGFWTNFANLEQELRAFLEQHGLQTMPTTSELQKAKRRDLLIAIQHHGGMYVVAGKLGLIVHQKPSGYWANLANVERELRAFMEEQGLQTMPMERELLQANRNDLVRAFHMYGGRHLLAEQLGLAIGKKRKPRDYWTDFINVEQELRAFMQEQGQHTMPTEHTLKKAKRPDLASAIYKHGGAQAVAARLGLVEERTN